MAMIFISGAAGVGKTTVIQGLKQSLPRKTFALHDIDESDLWTHDYEAWRKAKVDYWLQRSKSNSQFGINTVLCGIVWPKDVIDSSSFSEEMPIRYILLHASPEVISSRLLEKFGTEKRRNAFDKEKIKRMNDFVDGHIANSKKLLEVFNTISHSFILDTTESNASDVCDQVKAYLLKQNH